MDKVIRARFFAVEKFDESFGPSFSETLLKIGERSLDKREHDLGQYEARLEQISKRGKYLDGETVRLQTVGFPTKAKRGKKAQPLGLASDEGLGHGCAFRYYPKLGVLCYQTNRNGISASRLATYVNIACGADAFRVWPVLTKDAWSQLKRVKPRKFEIQVADPFDLKTVDPTQKSVAKALRELQELTGGVKIGVSVSMARQRRKFLSGPLIRGLTGWLVGERDEGRGQVEKIIIGGKDEDTEEPVVLDVLKAHLQGKRDVELPENDVDAGFAARMEAVIDIFNEQLAYLEDNYSES